MSMYQIPPGFGVPNINNSASSGVYNDDESGFYETLARIPVVYRSTSRQDFKSMWPKMTSVHLKYIFYSVYIVFFMLYLSSTQDESEGLITDLFAGSFAAGLIAFFFVGICMLFVMTRLALFKMSHKTDFSSISVTDLYRVSKLIRNRVTAHNPKFFSVTSTQLLNSINDRPDFYNHLPNDLRSKTRYEFRKIWGRTVVLNDRIIIPMIFIAGLVLYLVDKSLVGSLSFILVIILAYKIPQEASLKNLSGKYFPGVETKEVKRRIAATRSFVNGVDPNLLQRICMNVKAMKNQPSSQVNNVTTQVSQPSLHNSGPTNTPQTHSQHTVTNPPNSQVGTFVPKFSLLSLFGIKGKIDMVFVDTNAETSISSQYLSHVLEYERKLGIR